MYTHRQLEKTLRGLGYVHILQRKRERHEIINVEGKYVGNVRKGVLRERGRQEWGRYTLKLNAKQMQVKGVKGWVWEGEMHYRLQNVTF